MFVLYKTDISLKRTAGSISLSQRHKIFDKVGTNTWLPQNLENLEKGPILRKSVKTWKSQGKQLKQHISVGKVRE